MVGNDENILVEFDCQNIVLIDPNKTVDSLGNVSERQLKHEDLVYYANLECSLFPRTRLSSSSNGNLNAQTISIAKINFLKPGGKTFLNDEYLDEITGLNSIDGMGSNQIIEQKNSIVSSDGSTDNYVSQNISNNIDTQLLGITQISIDTQLNLAPEVTIEMEDIRGRALFEKGENSPYSVFFNYPYPLFYLTVKGYLGKAVKYQLALRTFNARFDSTSGNFKITVKFYAYKYNVLTQLPMKNLLYLPNMYSSKYTISPESNPNFVGPPNPKADVKTIVSSRGYQKIKEVYSEYKAKGLVDDDFPEITLQELITRLESLETYIANTFSEADMSPITDADNYRNTLLEYEKEIFLYAGESWFNRYMDTANFYIEKNTGRKIYTFKKQVREAGTRDAAISELKSKISTYNKKLSENKTFGNSGNKVKVGKVEINCTIPNNIDYNDFVPVPDINADSIDFVETYYQLNGKRGNVDEIAALKAKTQIYFNFLPKDKGNLWFYFEGQGSFEKQIQDIQNILNTKISEIQGKLSELLSSRLQDKQGGLGFKPTIKNIIAVLLASAEGFLRLMCDVHSAAWEERENKYRRDSVLGSDKTAASTDSKSSVQTSSGNLIPIYPWPQYFIETNDEKGEKYVLAYPGDPKVVSKTKGYLYDVWPEIEFVEEFLRGKVKTQNKINDGASTTNDANTINRVSLNSIDFPTSNVIFANKQESKFMYEIWERMLLMGTYQRFAKKDAEKEITSLIAETEFLNIQLSLQTDSPYLIQKLKQYGFNSTNYVPFLSHISNGGLGESWQKFIRDEFVTNYIQNEVDNSFSILDNSILLSGVNIVNPEPSQINKLTDYLKSTKTNYADFTDTFPFSVSNWFKSGLANGDSSNQNDIYNTTKVLEVNMDKKMISSFSPKTSTKEKRPITNFNFYVSNEPQPIQINLKSFYDDRNIEDQQPTEGGVFYKNYVGNLTDTQTTSILNTPYFVNSIQNGVTNFLTGNTHPYVSSAFLFLNSLPLATLREKFKTYENNVGNELDYIFASLKKFGALHKLPYAWILKYGSIWHRYKIWVENGYDILQNDWTNFNSVNNFDPATLNPNKIYNLTIKGSGETIGVQTTTNVGTSTITSMNVGFYPKVINDFNIFCRGYSLFTGYTDSAIQSQLDNTTSGFTLTFNDTSSFVKNLNYDPSNPNDILKFRTWSCLLLDTKKSKQYVVPSFGSNINQAYLECFDNRGKLYQQIKSNPAVINGSVRTMWSLPNYGYFDNNEVDIPSPLQYMKTILSGRNQQESFSLNKSDDYTNIEEMFSVFDKSILDILEEEFLKFSKSMYNTEVSVNQNTGVRTVNITKAEIDNNNIYRNFQSLMIEMLSTSASTNTNSEVFVNDVKSVQYTNFISTIQRFMEYDVVIKYGNPSGYNRRLFDSYDTRKFIEDKISYNLYVKGTLPSSNGSVTLASSKSSNPQAWKDLETYVGFSDEPKLKYTNSGSTITDFFIDMNIEFISDSVKTLAPLIKIYATKKKNDSTYNKAKFTNDLHTYLNDNQTFVNTVFNLLCNKIQTGLPNIVETKEKSIDTSLEGEQTKIDLWEKFKSINDTWIAGYDYTQTTFMEDVLLLDRANRNIGDEVYIDPVKVKNLLNNINEGSSVYVYLESILSIHHFICMMHPAYINYYNVQEVSKNNIPKTEGTLDFANNLFGTFLNVDTRSASPKLVCTYAAEPSEHLANDKNDNIRFKNDSFELKCGGDNPLLDKLDGKTDWGLSNKVVGFNVDIGVRNQNVFYHFDVSQDLGKQTSESLTQMDNLINQANGRTSATQNVSLWNFYNKRSYQSRVQCLGNVMIQPTMYFNLRYVPMFYGPYYILDVKHTITPGRFETTFTGIRQQVFALPKLENYMQTLTKTLFETLKNKITQKVTDTKTSVTSTTVNTVYNSDTSVSSSITVDNPNNCTNSLQQKFKNKNYISVNQVLTTINSQTVADGIKSNINGGTNNKITRLLSFVTMYLYSYQNGFFTAFNKNYCGTQLNYSWPDGLTNYFNKEYLCMSVPNVGSIPFATFESEAKMYEFLQNKWGPNSTITLSAENILKLWIKKWNKSWSENEYTNYKNENQLDYENRLSIVEDALQLADTLGL